MSNRRPRARGVVGALIGDFDTQLFGNAIEAAQYIIKKGLVKGKPETVANNIKKASYRSTKAYGYLWANVPKSYSQEDAQIQFRRIMSVNAMNTILDRFWMETLNDRCVEALETMVQNLADFTEGMVNEGILEDRLERDLGKKGE